MKSAISLFLFLFLSVGLMAQNINADGGIKVGDTNSTANGTIRFHNDQLQVRINNQWLDICTGSCQQQLNCNPFYVQSPAANQSFSQDFSVNANDQIVITVDFNQAVDPTTLVMGENFNFSASGFAGLIPGVTTWNSDYTTVTFVSGPSYPNFCSFNPSCEFTLVIIGTGVNGVKDASGCNLDGDNDGNPGGNWTTTFGLLG